MMKRILALLLALCLLAGLTACGQDSSIGIIGGADGPTAIFVTGEDSEEVSFDPDGWYYSPEEVSLYLVIYGCLPDNYITKAEARELGWEGGSVEDYAPGYAIGGDVFGNREGLLPDAQGRVYYECDVNTDGEDSRGAERLVYSNDGLIYYTADHYETFQLLYGEE